jgi:hypothetical protein
MVEMIKSVWSRGLLHSAGVLINCIVPERLFRFRIFRVYELQYPHGTGNLNSGDATPVAFRWCRSEDDLRLAKQLTDFRSSDQSSCDRNSACVALDNGTPVGGVWRAAERFDEDDLGIRLLLEGDQAWVFAAHVAKPHRGRGVYRQLLGHVLCDNPLIRHYASINPTNKPSIAAHKAFTRSTLGTCVVFRVLNIAFAWVAGNLSLDGFITWKSRSNPLSLRIESGPAT